ncbi:MAG: hypothetical protein BJ554DRAFT_2261 [Olpidium bornovanus]|uniref:Uncharacterized protein n=1 Tax=Olpidium bornovanus TaxID=278681 RepID=A0A8H7ZQP1_9FUNG|nr:MAG: hypothetical protein BJ554DRAFT_2261 [Olpidium bornovanus]
MRRPKPPAKRPRAAKARAAASAAAEKNQTKKKNKTAGRGAAPGDNAREARAAGDDAGADLAALAAVAGGPGKRRRPGEAGLGSKDERARKAAALEASLKISRTSTASVGRFDRRLKEDAEFAKARGARRKFAPVTEPVKKKRKLL